MGFCSCSMFCCAFVSNTSFAIILMRKRDLVALLLFVFLVSLGRCVALTHGATGLSAVCGSDIS